MHNLDLEKKKPWIWQPIYISVEESYCYFQTGIEICLLGIGRETQRISSLEEYIKKGDSVLELCFIGFKIRPRKLHDN